MADIKREDDNLITQRFVKILRVPKIVDAANKTFILDSPGFDISSFNRAGKLSFWSFMKFSEIIRQDFNRSKQEPNSEERLSVVSAQKVEVFPDFYARAALVLPLKIIRRPRHTGISSYSHFIEFKDAMSGSLYARIQRQVVNLDPVTRKPVRTPQSPVENNDVSNPPQPVFIPKWAPTLHTVTYTFKVCHSDSDNVYHTNQASYFRLCCDAAANACNESKLKNFSGDFFRYDVSGALIRYLGESFPGDDLEVTLWEDPVDLDALFFHIKRLNKLIFAAKCSYYKPSISANSKL